MATVNILTERNKNSAKVTDNFNIRWSGKMWSWKPGKVEGNIPSLTAASIPNMDSDAFEGVHGEKESLSTSKEMEEGSATKTGACTGNLTQPDISVLTLKQSLNGESSLIFTQNDITPTERSPLHSVPPFFEIRRSSMGGYGAFAIQDIKPYTIILNEPALLEASNVEFLEKLESLSSEEQMDFMNLACFDEISRDKRRAIFKTNRFYTASGRNGIFRIASRFNHSCLPQVVYHYSRTKKELVLSTRYFIPNGNEMFISYGQDPDTLLIHYGFICSCGSCSPIEPREVNPEQWELEYWQKIAPSEEFKEHLKEWGTESTEGVKSTEGTNDITDGWGADSTREVHSNGITNDAYVEW